MSAWITFQQTFRVQQHNEELGLYPLALLKSGALEGQENKARNDENKISGQLPLKEALVQSAEKCVNRKRRRDHPLNASPTATNSPGFSYRRASNPTTNAPKLQPTGKANKEAGTRKKKRARLMTFGSLPSLPVEEVPREEYQLTTAGVPGGGRSEAVVGSQAAKDKYCSPLRDLSTQAAFAFAQKEFQREFRSPLRNVTAASPEKAAGSQRTRTSTPPPSQPPAEYTAITPFKVFNKGKPFLAENQSQLEPAPVSTQELFNTATPLAFSTVKKDKSARKRVSMAVSPLKSVNDYGTGINAGKDESAAKKGGEGETTVAEVTFADLSTTPPTPNFPLFSQRAPPSAFKPPSLIPTLSSALKPRNPSFTAASRTTSQANSSFSRLAPPPSSAPVSSHPVRQEYRRVLSQGHRHSRSPSQSSQQQQRSSQQLAQRQPALLDDVDIDSAMDAADSFLDTANLDVDLKGPPAGSGARRAR
ncbi:Vacuolar protein sorting-associated protein 11 like [Lasiodiplodia theobromae]|uniref:Vacuolar protein sorting-associated protein 11 like n=1 Tax=Lasiodiplodia theobromae TaxID=45133 RepID=UPI0015C36485|nr:Vacuolar protein sorting-associated protein 11 like [Lasiodiplodia theobromae]KAF4534296.1 Vacuolar protein sorting-associated protein 11 like [Lasiodiplodia theobromae]